MLRPRSFYFVTTALTVYGIETQEPITLNTFNNVFVATALTVYGIETSPRQLFSLDKLYKLKQDLPFTVCAEGCEAAEEPSDDEVRTSQVPEQSEGKTKMIRKQFLPFTVLKQFLLNWILNF